MMVAARRGRPLCLAMAATKTESVLLPHGPTRVHWRRSARARRISLRIDAREGSVVVTLPARSLGGTTEAAGRALLMDHAGWVAERLARLPQQVVIADGATVPIDGAPVQVRHAPGLRGVRHEAGVLQVGGDPEFLGRRVVDHLRAEARQRLAAAAVAKAQGAGLRPRSVVVKDTRTRWGSCTASGTLMFSWRLLMAPPEVQDYVVAHEVAHLRHMDHSPRFWALVAELTPHRAAATRWLERGGAGLMRIG